MNELDEAQRVQCVAIELAAQHELGLKPQPFSSVNDALIFSSQSDTSFIHDGYCASMRLADAFEARCN